ncbi:MAG: hypothetical protein KH135_05235, partial [Firmicutes bacterium]|nr:hypothetical protein [Bacillota bacterium]
MKNKKIILSSVIVLVVLLLGGGIFYYFYNQNENTTLTIAEKQWIENNKNKVIDVGVVNDVLALTNDGKGVFFDFLQDLEKDTGLEFNESSYQREEKPNSSYSFRLVSKPTKNDIVFYEDNYVVLSAKNEKYNSLSEMDGKTFGILATDIKHATKYLNGVENIKFQPVQTIAELFALKTTDGIIVPKITYLKEILENDKLNLAYHIASFKKSYVLTLGDNNRLNTILKKYSKKWLKDSYEESYHKNFNDSFFGLSSYSEKDRANFKGKRYTYGFVNSVPFDTILNGKLLG